MTRETRSKVEVLKDMEEEIRLAGMGAETKRERRERNEEEFRLEREEQESLLVALMVRREPKKTQQDLPSDVRSGLPYGIRVTDRFESYLYYGGWGWILFDIFKNLEEGCLALATAKEFIQGADEGVYLALAAAETKASQTEEVAVAERSEDAKKGWDTRRERERKEEEDATMARALEREEKISLSASVAMESNAEKATGFFKGRMVVKNGRWATLGSDKAEAMRVEEARKVEEAMRLEEATVNATMEILEEMVVEVVIEEVRGLYTTEKKNEKPSEMRGC